MPNEAKITSSRPRMQRKDIYKKTEVPGALEDFFGCTISEYKLEEAILVLGLTLVENPLDKRVKGIRHGDLIRILEYYGLKNESES